MTDTPNNLDPGKLDARLTELREEFAKGETMLTQLEEQSQELRSKLLRISGAIQVLEELSDTDRTDP